MIRVKKACTEDVDKEILSAIRDVQAKPVPKPEQDEAELYANSLVPVLRRLTPYKLAYLKSRLSNLLLEIEFDVPEQSNAHKQTSGLEHMQKPTATV